MSKLLLTLVEILGILPVRQRKDQSLKILYRIYAILWMAFLISAYLYQLIERTKNFDTLNSALVVPGMCATLILYSTNLYITIKFHLGDGMMLGHDLMERLNKVDEAMGIQRKSKVNNTSSNFIKNLILTFGLLAAAVLINTTHALIHYRDHLAYLFVDNLHRIRLSVCTILICYTVRRIQTALREIHSILINLLNKRLNVNLNKAGRKQFHTFNDLPTTFNIIARMHVLLAECSAIFNQIYGFAIFLLDMYAISLFLVIFNATRITMKNEGMEIWGIVISLLFVVATLVRKKLFLFDFRTFFVTVYRLNQYG